MAEHDPPRAKSYRRHGIPSPDSAAWVEAGAIVAEAIGPRGSNASVVYERVSQHMSHVWAVNALAWLENTGHVVYNSEQRCWRLTSAGVKLAKKAA